MQVLEAWILSVLLSVLPPNTIDTNRDGETVQEIEQRYASIAHDLAEVVDVQEPLFHGAQSKYKTAALMIAVARYESTLRKDVDIGEERGDGGRSWCLMQINVGERTVKLGTEEMKTWKGPDLVQDRRKCFRAGLEHLRASIQQCRLFKTGAGLISGYIPGPNCVPDDKRSDLRWKLARRILTRFPEPKEPEPGDELAYGG
jgi:hypothetical protein